MKNPLVLVGIAGIIVIVGAWYAFGRGTASESANQTIPQEKTMTSSLELRSTAFESGASIPPQFTCDGAGVSPALEWSGVPDGAASLVLIVDDPDVPKVLRPDGVFDHWTLFNIPPETTGVPEGGTLGIAGANGAGRDQYAGPCPPREYEPSEHRYFFRLYALDAMLDLPGGASKAEVLGAMEGHVVAEAELMGTYKRITE